MENPENFVPSGKHKPDKNYVKIYKIKKTIKQITILVKNIATVKGIQFSPCYLTKVA
jgi:hypothetical protein